MQRQKTLIIILIVVGIVAVLGFVLWQKSIIKLPTFTPTPTPIIAPVEKEITLSLVKEYNIDLGVWKQTSSGNYIYLAMDNGILGIIDVSDPKNPKTVSFLPQTGFVMETYAIVYKNNYLYVSGMDIGDEVGMDIFDVSDPANPRGVWYQKGLIEQIGISDNYLFLLGSKFWIFDISNPEKPSLIGDFKDYLSYEGMYISGNRAYLSDGNEGLLVLDISGKKKPTIIGKYRKWGEDILVFDTIVYEMTNSSFSDKKDQLAILDTTDPKNITLLKTFEREQLAELYPIGKNLFVTYKKGILVFDISNPADPILQKDIPGDFGLISGQGKYLYSIIDNPSNFRQSLLKIYEIKYE